MQRSPHRRPSSPSMAKLGRKLDHLIQTTDHEHDLLHTLVKRQENIMTTIAAINAAIDAAGVEAEETTVAVEAIAGYVTAIKDQLTKVEADLAAAIAGSDPAAMQAALDKLAALNAKIDAQQVALSALQGTPSEEPDPVDPTT